MRSSALDKNTPTLERNDASDIARDIISGTLGNSFSPRRVPFMSVISGACYAVPTVASQIAIGR